MAGGDIVWTCVHCKIMQDGDEESERKASPNDQMTLFWDLHRVSNSRGALESWTKRQNVTGKTVQCDAVCFMIFVFKQMSLTDWLSAKGMLKPVIPLPSLISARCRKKESC